jgi:hypothetical protein
MTDRRNHRAPLIRGKELGNLDAPEVTLTIRNLLNELDLASRRYKQGLNGHRDQVYLPRTWHYGRCRRQRYSVISRSSRAPLVPSANGVAARQPFQKWRVNILTMVAHACAFAGMGCVNAQDRN